MILKVGHIMLRDVFGTAASRRTDHASLIACEDTGVWLRFMTMEDIPKYYEWIQDDPVMKEMAAAGNLPCYEQIYREMREQLYHNDKRVYTVAEKDGQFIGTSVIYQMNEFDREVSSDLLDIGYIVDREHRGQGYGNVIARLTSEMIRDFPQQATIRADNTASIRTIISAGFHEKEDAQAAEHGWRMFEKHPQRRRLPS